MTSPRIDQLVRLLPPEAEIFSPNRRPGDPITPFAEYLAASLNDPGFGHRFVIEFVKRGDWLPASVYERWIRRAYQHIVGNNTVEDSILVRVEQLASPPSAILRSILNALLLTKEGYAVISDCLGLAEEVVRFYEQLHFNVRDRFSDKAYIAGLVFPEGRFESLKPDAVEQLPVAKRLLMAGYLSGADEVLWLAGMNTERPDPPSVDQSLKAFEELVMENAVRQARTGSLNSTKAPGILHAKSMVLAAKRNSDVKKPVSADPFSSPISIGQSILLSMRDEITEQDQKDAKAKLDAAVARLRAEGASI